MSKFPLVLRCGSMVQITSLKSAKIRAKRAHARCLREGARPQGPHCWGHWEPVSGQQDLAWGLSSQVLQCIAIGIILSVVSP